MTAQRILSGLLIFLAAASALVLLKPDLFPDIHLPKALSEAPQLRTLVGALLAAVTGFIVFAVASARRAADEAARRRAAREPMFEAPLTVAEAESPVAAETVASGEAVEAAEPTSWRRLVDSAPAVEVDAVSEPPIEPAPEVGAAPESPAPDVAADEAEPAPLVAAGLAAQTLDAANDAHDRAAAESKANLAAELPTEAQLVEKAETAAGEPSDQQRLVELVREAEAAQANGRGEEALALYDTALAKARAIYTADPTRPEGRLALAETLSRMASLEDADNAPIVALRHHEEALGLHRAVAGAAPDKIEYSEGLALALHRTARAYEGRGQQDKAQALYGEAARTVERLAWLHPGEDRYEGLLKAARSHLTDRTRSPEPAA